MHILSAMFIAAVSGAGLAALGHSIDGTMHVAISLVLLVCILLAGKPKKPQDSADSNKPEMEMKEEAMLVPFLKAQLIRPALIALVGFGSFIQMFAYLRDL